MKKLLFILLLLPFFAKAQTTYQLNYDSIRVNKTAGTGGTSLYGKVYLKNVGAGSVADSILSVFNGRIRKISGSGAFIQNQNAGAQSSSNFWLSGVGRAPTLKATEQLFVGQQRLIDTAYNDSRQLMLIGDRGDSSAVFVVRQDYNGVGAGRNIAGSNVQAPDGLGDYYQGGMHIYGSNYNVPFFRGKINFTTDNGTGSLLRSINTSVADSAVVHLMAGVDGSVNDVKLTVRGGTAGDVGINTRFPKGDLHIFGDERASVKTYSGLIGNSGGGDAIVNAYRLDLTSNYLRYLDIVSLGDDVNNRASSTRFLTTNTSGVTSSRYIIDSVGNNNWSGSGFFGGSVTVPDVAYSSGWDGDLTVPTKNAVWDAFGLGGGFWSRTGTTISPVTANDNLSMGTGSITGGVGSFTSSGSTGAATITQSSGAGVGLTITKGGNGEGLIVNKTSGSGNAVTVTGSTVISGDVGIGTTSPLSKFHVRTGTDQNARFRPGTEVGGANGVAINTRTDDDSALQEFSIRASNINLINSASVIMQTAPATSAGTYDGLTRNTSTGAIEKIGLVSGTYTPTLTNVTNVSTSSVGTNLRYIRVGNVVSFSLEIVVNPTTLGNCQVDFSIPIASNFTTVARMPSVAKDKSASTTNMYIESNVANDRGSVFFNSTAGAVTNIQISGHYEIE